MAKYETLKAFKGVRRREGQSTWNARYSVKLPNRPIISGELTGFKTPKEAYEARILKIAEIKAYGTDVTKVYKKHLFSEVYKEYYDSCIDKATNTLKKYDSLYRQHLAPAFGDKNINDITIADIELFFKEKGGVVKEKRYSKEITYSNEYLQGFKKLLKNIFDYADKKEYLAKKNPMKYISKDIYTNMGREKEEGQYINKEQMTIILERLINSRLQPSVMIAYHTGMRLGEVFGLLWTDIDLDKKVIKVEKQLIDFNGIWCFAKPKTPAAFRTIPISEQLVIYLRLLKSKHEKEKEELGDMYISHNNVGTMINNHEYKKVYNDLPFVNRKANGMMLTPASFKSASIAINQLGIFDSESGKCSKISFHDFRHTHITELILKGISPNTLKKRVGHEKISTTLDIYKRVTQTDKEIERDVINKIDLPTFEEVKERIDTLNVYLVEREYDKEEPEKITSAQLLGGAFNRKGFIPDNQALVC